MSTNEKLKNFLLSTALVVDDEIINCESTISKIVATLEDKGTLFIKLRDLPGSVDGISDLGFIILDWDLRTEEDVSDIPQEVLLGSTLLEVQKNDVKEFIKDIITRYFVPIFIFTRENIEAIKTNLESDDVIKVAIEKRRIFLCNKSDLAGEQIIAKLNDWLNESIAVYTFKIMEEAIERAKHRFFNELDLCDPKWPCHVYQTLKKDSPADINSDFQEFLMSSYTSAIEPIRFNHDGFDQDVTLSDEEILKIYSKIKFFAYQDDWCIGPHPGDLYEIDDGVGGEYYINVSAACDMRNGEYYFIRGKAVAETQEKICLYNIYKIKDKEIVMFDFRCVKIAKPQSNYNLLKFGDKNNTKIYRRVGRLLNPYIRAMQEKFSHYIIRTGTMRDPNMC